MVQPLIYNDLLLGPLVFHGKEAELLGSAELSRIRHLKQLSTCYLFNPHALHTRYHHTIGMAGIVKFFIQAQTPSTTPSPPDQFLLVAAALAHDIGHPAWCHVGEVFAQLRGHPKKHDEISARLVMGEFDQYLQRWKTNGNRICEIIDDECDRHMIADLIQGKAPVPPHHDDGTPLSDNEKIAIEHEKIYMGNIIKGPADFDRAEFLMRDSFMSSSLPGLIDVRKIAGNICITQERATGTKILAYSNMNFAEAMLMAKELLYPGIYLESHNLIAEELLMRALDKLYPPAFDILDFWFSTDDQVTEKMRSSSDPFVQRVLKLMDAVATYDLIAEIKLDDPRLEEMSRANIKFLGSDLGRPKILEFEDDVANQLSNVETGDFVVGCWTWKKPKVMTAAVEIEGRLSTIGMESRLLEVLDTERYVNSRSKIVIGVWKDKINSEDQIVNKVIEQLSAKSYLT